MGKALHRYCREENIMFFLVCLLNPGNVKKEELVSRTAAFSQGRKQQRSLLRWWWTRRWCGKDRKAFSLLWLSGASWHTKENTHHWYSQQTPPSKEYFYQRKDLSQKQCVQFMNNSNHFHLTYLKTRDNKKISILRATVWLDSSHPHKNFSPSPFFTGFL